MRSATIAPGTTAATAARRAGGTDPLAAAGRLSVFLLLLLLWVAAPLATARGEEDPAAPAVPTESQIREQDALMKFALTPWTGDLDGMVKRRMIRVLTVYNRIFYFTDRFQERGVTYELMKAFEEEVNKKLGLKSIDRVRVVLIPVSRDRLLAGLAEGIGDVAAENITITPEREQSVDFSVPFTDKVREVLVTGPASGAIASIEDLAGQEIVVRKSSSYYESLIALNERFRSEGKPEIVITLADELLEDDDIAEMVNAGLYPAMIMDLHKAKLWAQVFDKIAVHPEIALREGGRIAWAMRKDNSQLKAVLDDFVGTHKVGSELTNILIKRYLRSTKFVNDVSAASEREKFELTVAVFQQYASEYNFDWLLMIAQGYQESKLDQSVKSAVGAVGIMQVLPKTAAGHPIGIPDITDAEANIHAGIKYMRFMVDQYFSDPAISALDRHPFAFAAYNAGPNRIDRLRRKAADQGLDPNVWFDNVELLVSKEVGREPVDYVANIFKYYIAYKRIEEQRLVHDQAKERAAQQP